MRHDLGVIEYLLTYPDLRHHPLEDRTLEHLQVKDLSAAEPFFGLYAEHREQAQTLRRIAAATQQRLQDASMPRRDYIRLLSSFVAAQRDQRFVCRFHRLRPGGLPARG